MLNKPIVLPNPQRTFRYSVLSLLVLCSCYSSAEDASAPIEIIEIKGLSWPTLATDDTYNRLQQAGVDFSAAGGVAALPVLNGMMGNRIKVLIDGSDISAACANDMNPPLSYVSGNQISQVTVVAGISPVSMGGDNIGGVISISTINPQFKSLNDHTLKTQTGFSHQRSYLGSNYQSNGDIMKSRFGTEFTSSNVSLKYDGAFEDANSYRDGNDNKVPDTLYRAQNHQLVAAWQDNAQQLAIKLSHQYIPFQGFANQYMDMTENNSVGVTVQYLRQLAAGELLARVNWQSIEHEMGFFTPEKPGTMPMLTDSNDYSYQLHWTTALSGDATLKLGQEFYQFRLDDIWPAVPGSMMMGMMAADAIAAQAFNQQDRKQADNLLDLTFLASYQLTAKQQLQLGLAQKNRAPTLYERYSWGQGTMAITMIGWFGDGNGYIGDIQLKPETARTASIGYQYSSDNWQLQVRPFYTKVSDYIDVEVAGSFNSGDNSRNRLQFSNLDATLYGVEASSLWLLSNTDSNGQWRLLTELNLNRGKGNDDSPLYQQRPLNTAISLQHQQGKFQTQLKWQWQDSKHRVDSRRLENQTSSYALLSLTSQWQNDQLTLNVGINNLLDKDYALPLGGVNIGKTTATALTHSKAQAAPLMPAFVIVFNG